MDWRLIIDHNAEKQLKKIPKKYAERLRVVIQELTINPYGGDIEKKWKGKARSGEEGLVRIEFSLRYIQ